MNCTLFQKSKRELKNKLPRYAKWVYYVNLLEGKFTSTWGKEEMNHWQCGHWNLPLRTRQHSDREDEVTAGNRIDKSSKVFFGKDQNMSRIMKQEEFERDGHRVLNIQMRTEVFLATLEKLEVLFYFIFLPWSEGYWLERMHDDRKAYVPSCIW